MSNDETMTMARVTHHLQPHYNGHFLFKSMTGRYTQAMHCLVIVTAGFYSV